MAVEKNIHYQLLFGREGNTARISVLLGSAVRTRGIRHGKARALAILHYTGGLSETLVFQKSVQCAVWQIMGVVMAEDMFSGQALTIAILEIRITGLPCVVYVILHTTDRMN